MITVVRAGALTTVQDRGRFGHAHLGVPRGGPLDAPAAALANRLVGNDADAALLEITLGGFAARCDLGCWVALTGAPAPLRVDGGSRAQAAPTWVPAGSEVVVEVPATGVRSYLAVAGGIAVEPVLGSRSTDTLAWVGPPRVVEGTVLPIGSSHGRPVDHDTPRPRAAGPLRIVPGPHAQWFGDDAVAALCRTAYVVGRDSDRIGLRLAGPAVARGAGELPSEGIVAGAVQVPPDGLPVVLLADHPTTGGYPVIGIVEESDLWRCAQLRPGEPVRFAPG